MLLARRLALGAAFFAPGSHSLLSVSFVPGAQASKRQHATSTALSVPTRHD